MEVYKWGSTMKFAGYVGKTDAEDRQVSWPSKSRGIPLPPLAEWKTPTLVQYLGEGPRLRKPKVVGDCVATSYLRIISQAAADALADVWEKNALLYPVRLDDVPDQCFYIVVPRIALDCLDWERSKFARCANGQPYLMNEWVIREDALGDADLFSIPLYPGHSPMNYYVTERFRQRVIDAGLGDFVFGRMWPDPKPLITRARRPRAAGRVPPATDVRRKAAEWMRRAETLIAAAAWDDFETLCREVETACLRARNHDALLAFHETCLKRIASPEDHARIRIDDLTPFAQAFAALLDQGLARAQADPAVRALYFEYFYDGDDASTGNLFLCESFDPDDEEWASDFGHEGVLPGPSVLPWLDFDPDLAMPDRTRLVGERYVDAQLLVACAREIEARGGIAYPFGFARHDWALVLLSAGKGDTPE